MTEGLERFQDAQNGRRGKEKKIDLVGGEGGILKLAGWTVIISGESFFAVKEVNK